MRTGQHVLRDHQPTCVYRNSDNRGNADIRSIACTARNTGTTVGEPSSRSKAFRRVNYTRLSNGDSGQPGTAIADQSFVMYGTDRFRTRPIMSPKTLAGSRLPEGEGARKQPFGFEYLRGSGRGGRFEVSCCRFRGRRDKVFSEPEGLNATTEVQPGLKLETVKLVREPRGAAAPPRLALTLPRAA